jgi:hypothetical protein
MQAAMDFIRQKSAPASCGLGGHHHAGYCAYHLHDIKGKSFMSKTHDHILRAIVHHDRVRHRGDGDHGTGRFRHVGLHAASCSAYVFVSMYLWYGLPLWMCILVTILATLVMYQLTMFLILVCKIPDMLATCALMFVHQGLGQWYIGGGAVSTGMRLPNGNSPARTMLSGRRFPLSAARRGSSSSCWRACWPPILSEFTSTAASFTPWAATGRRPSSPAST